MALRAPPSKPEFRRISLEVLLSMDKHIEEEVERFDNRPLESLWLSVLAGSYLTFASILAAVFSDGVAEKVGTGIAKPLGAMGFVIGFSMVVLSGSLLFTELNASAPLHMFVRPHDYKRTLRMWWFVLFGNAVGALLVAALVNFADSLSSSQVDSLEAICVSKLKQKDEGTKGWFMAFVSGVLANWLVGMAAFFAGEGRTVPGKIIGLAGPITAFASIGFQHSIANMGFFFVALVHGGMPFNVGDALWWNIIPAILGNVVGAGFFVGALFYLSFGLSKRHLFFLAPTTPTAPTPAAPSAAHAAGDNDGDEEAALPGGRAARKTSPRGGGVLGFLTPRSEGDAYLQMQPLQHRGEEAKEADEADEAAVGAAAAAAADVEAGAGAAGAGDAAPSDGTAPHGKED